MTATQKYVFNLDQQTGIAPVDNASILVQNFPSLTTASLYTGASTLSPTLTNPLITAPDGSYWFYAISGNYQFSVTLKNGTTLTIPPSEAAVNYQFDSNNNPIGLATPSGGTIPIVGVDRTITASGNAQLSDAGALITANSGSAVAVTIQNDATVGWATDSALLVYQEGAGAISFVAGAGVTLNAGPSAPAAAQYVILGAMRVAANTWVTF